MTKTNPYGLVSLALGRACTNGELWAIVSNGPTALQTFREYGLRFDIEENFRIGQVQRLSIGEFRNSFGNGRVPFVLGVGSSHSLPNGYWHAGGRTRKTPLGRSALEPRE